MPALENGNKKTDGKIWYLLFWIALYQNLAILGTEECSLWELSRVKHRSLKIS